MTNSRKLSALAAAAVAAAMLSGTSAFAETRHRGVTSGNDSASQSQQQSFRSSDQTNRQDRGQGGSTQRWGGSQSQNGQFGGQGQRNGNRGSYNGSVDNRGSYNNRGSYDNRGSQAGSYNNRSYDNRGSYGNRGSQSGSGSYNNRSYDNRGSYGNRGSYNGSQNNGYRGESRRSESFEGRVSRVEHYGGGYRVWVGGAGYPFFISADRWSRFPIRVGLSVRLGGYWDPAGYYDVYDVGPYATAGNIHGIVESVDYRRGTAVLRDDVSGSFVTIVLRGNDPRFGALRPGDYADLTGAWNRAGVFDAYSVADLRGGGYGQYNGQYNDQQPGY
jgi:hypothetical protein